MKIRISLPEDRDYAGRLEVLDASGAVVLGPLVAAGRAHDQPAAAHGNALRNPLLPYGDTPLGGYVVVGVVGSGQGTGLDGKVFGGQGVVQLEPISGAAAVADAQGRFRLFIQGGGEDEAGLRATTGAIRLQECDQKELVALLRRVSGRVICEVVTTGELGAKVVVTQPPPDCDPPALPTRPTFWRPATNRRSLNFLASAGGVAVGRAKRLFVVPEHSGSGGGTGYGGGGGDAGASDGGVSIAGTGTDSDQSVVSQPVVTSTDSAPSPGADMTTSSQEPVVIENASGASQLLSTAAQTGFSDQYSTSQCGWSAGQPTAPQSSLASYVGTDVETYSGEQSDAGNPNYYTGSSNVNPSTGQSVSSSQGNTSPNGDVSTESFEGEMSSGPFTPSEPVENQSVDTTLQTVPAVPPASSLPEESFEGGMSSGPFTPSEPVENQSVDTTLQSGTPVSTDSALPEESFEGGMSSGPFTPSEPVENQSLDTTLQSGTPVSTDSALPEESFEGGMSSGPFTPSEPVENQSVDTTSQAGPPTTAGADDDDDDYTYQPAVHSFTQFVNTGAPGYSDTGFDDIDQFLNQQAMNRAFNDAVFGEGDYDFSQQRLQDTMQAIDNLIPQDAFIIVGGEIKDPELPEGAPAQLVGAGEAFAVAGIDRTTFETYIGGAAAIGPSYGPVSGVVGAEWTTAGGLQPIGIVDIGEGAGAGAFVTPEERGGYVYVGSPFFVGLGVGWKW